MENSWNVNVGINEFGFKSIQVRNDKGGNFSATDYTSDSASTDKYLYSVSNEYGMSYFDYAQKIDKIIKSLNQVIWIPQNIKDQIIEELQTWKK